MLDDATSEIYYAQLVDAESTRTVMTALREVVEAKEALLQRYFKSPVIQGVTMWRPWIEERQKAQPSAYAKYLKLVARWRAE